MSSPDGFERGCEVDGHIEDTYGAEHYWHCDRPGEIDVDGTLMCLDHAGEQGYGPRQEEYGFDPGDGLNPTPEITRRPEPERVSCKKCDSDTFAVYYDPQAMGSHVECASCGTVHGGLR